MKTFLKIVVLSGLSFGIFNQNTFAGNEKRSGQAGAQELLINPWTKTSGFGGNMCAITQGVEAMNGNIGGLSFQTGTEVMLARTNWLSGTGININSVGFAQGLKNSGTLGISVTSYNFGDIEIRTIDNPEGGLGTFSPQFLNIGIGYSKTFSKSIHTGVLIRTISESIADVKASGISLDAGVQYVSGKKDRFKFGITLKNAGPAMTYRGVGLDFKTDNTLNGSKITAQRRADQYELPTQLQIGISRDYEIDGFNMITLLGNFTSNSFTADQYTGGLMYSYRKNLMIRAAYTYENPDNITYGNGTSTTPYNGFSAGATFELPLNEDKSSLFGVDYGFRMTHNVGPFNNTHSFGVRLSF